MIACEQTWIHSEIFSIYKTLGTISGKSILLNKETAEGSNITWKLVPSRYIVLISFELITPEYKQEKLLTTPCVA